MCADLQTFGGNSPADLWVCVFPYTYNGVQRFDCITDDNNGILWCATTSSYDEDGYWANCMGKTREILELLVTRTDP